MKRKKKKKLVVFLSNLLAAILLVSILPNFAMAEEGDSIPKYLTKVEKDMYGANMFKYKDKTFFSMRWIPIYESNDFVIDNKGNIKESPVELYKIDRYGNFPNEKITYTKNTGKFSVNVFGEKEIEWNLDTETGNEVAINTKLKEELISEIGKKYPDINKTDIDIYSKNSHSEWVDYYSSYEGSRNRGIINVKTKEIIECIEYPNRPYSLGDNIVNISSNKITRYVDGKKDIIEGDEISMLIYGSKGFNKGNSMFKRVYVNEENQTKVRIYEYDGKTYNKTFESKIMLDYDVDKNDQLWALMEENNKTYVAKYENGSFIRKYEVSNEATTFSVYDDYSIVVYKELRDGWYTIINHDPNGVSVTLNQEEVRLNQWQKQDLKVQVTPEMAIDEMKWTSSNPKIVDVTSEGKVTGMAIGEATVTAEVKINEKIYTASAIVKVDFEKSDWNTHWGADYIRKAMGNNWVTASDKFRPNDAITRAEFVKIVNKAYGYTEKADEPYTDVNSKDWFYDEVKIAVKAGYITTANPTFRPNDPITREEVAVIVTRIMKNKDTNLDKIKTYEDYKEVSLWAQSSVEGAIEAGYMGVGGTKFYPISNITRAESVTTLTRVVK